MDVRPRPNILWRLFVLVGLGTAGAVTVSDEAWETWQDVAGDAIPRDVFRSVFLGSLGLHAAESLYVYLAARRGSVSHPCRWAISALLWGFPVTRRLRRARAQVGAQPAVAPTAAAA